jgi:hypothetical protein
MRNTRFSSFLKPQLRIDTIPKPIGLGSHSTHEGHSTECAFIEYSMNIRWLFNACSISLKWSSFANGR